MKNTSEASDRERLAGVISKWIKNLSQDPLLLNHRISNTSSNDGGSGRGKHHIRRQSDLKQEVHTPLMGDSGSNSNISNSSSDDSGVANAGAIYNQKVESANGDNENVIENDEATAVWSV